MATEAPEPTGVHVPVHNWGWFLLRGILALALGVATVAFPFSAFFAFTILFAAYAFVDGIASLVSGIPGTREGERWGLFMLRGIVGILVGVLVLIMPVVATVTYAFLTVAMLAAWSIVAGLLEIAAAIRLRKEIEGEWLLGASGAISILLGLAILVFLIPNPLATILSAAWLIAIYAFVAGVVLVLQAFRLKANAGAK